MPVLCLMLSDTYHAQNYAGVIGLGLATAIGIGCRWYSAVK